MNINRLPAHIMILLILLQSFSAVAKLADIHVFDSEHIKTEHIHALDDHPASAQSTQTGENGQHNHADCHHCGHCNGSHVQFAALIYICKNLHFKINHFFDYLKIVIEAPISQLLRPPKISPFI
ncbi:hypothetical protein DS2_07118 [Catenovulum agarivorans DS-2]|uniref:DUF2946 domain-containing protein n=2 Tax=Catenovulum agarivorans TaxID=1172192 RepID=W7QRW7_9ALTE|nr:hypothetical protein DS2_07118 [Catenovulum agarivorans DS-2]